MMFDYSLIIQTLKICVSSQITVTVMASMVMLLEVTANGSLSFLIVCSPYCAEKFYALRRLWMTDPSMKTIMWSSSIFSTICAWKHQSHIFLDTDCHEKTIGWWDIARYMRQSKPYKVVTRRYRSINSQPVWGKRCAIHENLSTYR